MNEVKHTPGPWETLGGGLHGDEPDRWCVVATRDERKYFIAEIQNGAPGDALSTEEANARLIAAAPELLAACESFTKLLKAYSEDEGAMYPDCLLDTVTPTIRDAIAKARGKG